MESHRKDALAFKLAAPLANALERGIEAAPKGGNLDRVIHHAAGLAAANPGPFLHPDWPAAAEPSFLQAATMQKPAGASP